VSDPERYGVVTFDKDGKACKLEEKPEMPESNWAVTGLYVFDKKVCKLAKTLKPSSRGELEITDLIRLYLDTGSLETKRLGRGFAWLDTGTFDSLHEAASFVRTVELRQGIKIACLEEIAFSMGYINAVELKQAAASLGKNEYSAYLLKVLKASHIGH
jgi:glucose-1-phosphate thymidylyltransferase